MSDDSDYTRWKAEKAGETERSKDIPDYLRSIDGSLRTIRQIAIWFLVVSIIGILYGFFAAIGVFR